MTMAGALQLTQSLSQCSISAAGPNQAAATLASRSTSLWSSNSKLSSNNNGVALRTKRGAPAVGVALGQTEDYEETEEEIQAGSEARYAKAFGASSPRKKFEPAAEDKDGEGTDAAGGRARQRGDFEERVVQIRRVTKVVKGRKQLSFRAVIVVGDKKGKVGWASTKPRRSSLPCRRRP